MSELLAPDAKGIARAAKALREGKLVVFPTETVYGVGANALDPEAVRRIFAAKGRPADNPLIVHVADTDAARKLSRAWPEAADKLARAFWPGPLTLVLVAPRRGTLAFRVPDNAVARRLIAASGGGLPVTSANRSGQPDARTAEEVLAQLDGRVSLVLDGGRTTGDRPSTVVDCTTDQLKILREGAISASEIERALRQAKVA